MTNLPGPVKQGLSKGSVIGVGLSVFALILFAILWKVFEQLGMDYLPRLFASVCIPPAVIAGLIGAYVLLIRPASKPKE